MNAAICPNCLNNQFTEQLTTIDYSNTKEEFKIAACTQCGMRVTLPQPEEKEIHRYYKSANYISHKEKPDSIIESLYVQARKFTLRWKISVIQSFTKERNLLDYGCGSGDFIKHCISVGYNVSGYEPTKEAAEVASRKTGKPVFTDLTQIKTKFSVITLWHVLEHVHRLNETLIFLKSVLQENGIIFIAVPNYNSHDAATYKEHWAGYDVPRHLWHFDKTTMKSLLKKHNLKISQTIPMKLDPYYISLISEQYKDPGKSLVNRMTNAVTSAWKSNSNANKTGEYSSIIYVVEHA
jgi:2-polyprenyl-3-methyl-5-hydroxy-6-metoxy-1,4-benzoquinol methylase